jgi:peptide/nickel transport system permease protein
MLGFIYKLLKLKIVFIVVSLKVSLIAFSMYYLAPGDKALAIARAQYSDESAIPLAVINEINNQYHLEQPFLVQYWHWLSQTIQADFGVSLVSNSPVWLLFLENIKETITLTLAAMSIGLVTALLLSLVSLYNQGKVLDRIVIAMSCVGAAIPSYWLALILILIFAARYQWLPAYGVGTIEHLILPSITLSVWLCASQTRLLRSFFLKAKAQPFIEVLKLRGVSELEILYRHILRHSIIPVLTMLVLELAFLLEGAVVVEIIFARSGIGSLLVSSVMSRDYPVVLFLVMFSAICYLSVNLLLEILQQCLDPRLKTANLKVKSTG